MLVIQTKAPQSAIEGVSRGREELEARYAACFDERLALRQWVTYVPNKTEPVHRWFPYKEGFSYKLVELLLHEFGADPARHRVMVNPVFMAQLLSQLKLTGKRPGLPRTCLQLVHPVGRPAPPARGCC